MSFMKETLNRALPIWDTYVDNSAIMLNCIFYSNSNFVRMRNITFVNITFCQTTLNLYYLYSTIRTFSF